MRCLYCGKQLALLKRLTGGGDFCSDAHKHSYQEEYNRLALSRLLQAQSKPGEVKFSANRGPAPTPSEGLGEPLPPGASRRRALPASAPAPEPARAPSRSERVFYAPAATEEPVPQAIEEAPPVVQQPPRQTVREMPPAQFVPDAVEDITPEIPYETAVEAPPEVTVFSMEIPGYSALADASPYVDPTVEPWLDIAPAPAWPAWQAANPWSFNLPLGALEAIARPSAGEMEVQAVTEQPAPLEFVAASVSLGALSEHSFTSAAPAHNFTVETEHPLSALPAAEMVPLQICSSVGGTPLAAKNLAAGAAEFAHSKTNLHVPFQVAAMPSRAFPAASPIELDIRVSASRAAHETSLNGAVRFPVRITFQDSSLLNLYPSGIDFPAEESEVVLIAPWAEEIHTPSNGFNGHEFDSGEFIPADEIALAEMEPSGSPREVLGALARLHQDLAAEHQEEILEEPVEPPAADLELVSEPVAPNTIAAAPAEPSAATIDISAEPADQRPVPGSAHDLFEIPLKTFAPLKPVLAVESNALLSLTPEMPRMKALPLRPKVAKAPPGFSPQPGAVPAKTPAVEPKSKVPAPAPAAPRSTQIPAPAAKQPAPPVKAPPTVQPVKPGQPSKPGQPVKPVPPAKPSQAAKPAQPPAKTTKAPAPVAPTQTKQPATAPPAEPAAGESKVPDPALPGAPEPTVTPSEAAAHSEETMPSFASIQTGKNVSFIGSLKGKLILAILLVFIAGVVFYSMSSKSHQPAAPAATSTDEGVGPSIMMGEGGWVQGWGGDPNGSHAGRQITIYRPSLKLSDYRIEFQGEIDSKSIGWVFRAMDPYNYYAMKLAIATPGVSPKMELVKYIVVQGHETEIGRVPLDIAARNDTVFNVREDVRGSKFSTFVQGQQVDVWTDEQIKSGGVGFLNERAERARIKSAAISYLTGGKN
jgi:hypothetical protein